MTALTPTNAKAILHEGTGIEGFEVNGAWHIAMRQVCRVFELDWSAQYRRIQRDPILSAGVVTIDGSASNGGRDIIALRADLFWGWLFKLDLARLSDDVQVKLIPFQRAGYEALHRHFTHTAPVGPATDLEARVAALEAAQRGIGPAAPAAPRPTHYTLPVATTVRRMRADHPSAAAILGLLRESAAPLSAQQIHLVLTERGLTAHDAKYFTVCLRRLECAGAVARVAYGLYAPADTIEIPPRLPEGRRMGWDD